MCQMKAAFSSLKVQGFRHLKNLDLNLAPLNVLIGANGVGKTSVLEVMGLLAASATGRLQGTLSDAGGLSSVKTLDRQEPMRLQLTMPVEGEEPIHYELSLHAGGLGYTLPQERLTQHRAGELGVPLFKFIDSQGSGIRYLDPGTSQLVRPTWEHKPLETSLAQVPKMFRQPERFREVLASSTLYHALDVSPRAPVRLPQAMQPAPVPGQQGEGLVSCLYFLRETQRDRFEAVEDALRVAFPNFDRLDFPPAAAGSLTMAWRDRQFTHPLYPHQLSEGTLRFLWLGHPAAKPGLAHRDLDRRAGSEPASGDAPIAGGPVPRSRLPHPACGGDSFRTAGGLPGPVRTAGLRPGCSGRHVDHACQQPGSGRLACGVQPRPAVEPGTPGRAGMSVRIALLVEDATEQALIPKLREFLKARLPPGTMPRLDPMPCDGRLPTQDKLRRKVDLLLSGKKRGGCRYGQEQAAKLGRQ